MASSQQILATDGYLTVSFPSDTDGAIVSYIVRLLFVRESDVLITSTRPDVKFVIPHDIATFERIHKDGILDALAKVRVVIGDDEVLSRARHFFTSLFN